MLPGWIAGTARAHRHELPEAAKKYASEAKANTYGSLIGTVSADGTIQFEFNAVNEPDVPAAVVSRYGQEFVHYCFAENK